MTLKSPRTCHSRNLRQRQLNQSIAEAAHHLVELVREHIDTNDFDLVDHIMVGRYVSVVFVDESQSDITEWRRR